MLSRLLLIAVLAAVSACDSDVLNHDPKAVFDNEDAYDVSNEIVQVIRTKNIEAFLARAHPDAITQDGIREKIQDFFSYFPEENDFEITHYYSELRRGTGEYEGTPIYFTGYDVLGSNGFAQLLLAIAPLNDECCVVTYWRITPTESRPSNLHEFSFENKTWKHFIFFGLLIAVPLFIVLTAIACTFSKPLKRKWLWLIFILFGFWGAELNWTTGEIQNNFFQASDVGVNFQLFSFHLLGAGFVKSGHFQPWIITVGIPLGAVLYWLGPARRTRRQVE